MDTNIFIVLIRDILSMFAALMLTAPYNVIMAFVMVSLAIALIYKILN